MVDIYESRRRKPNRARERQRRRQNRSMATPREEGTSLNRRFSGSVLPSTRFTRVLTQRVSLLAQDAWWYLRNTPIVAMGIGAVIGIYLLLFAGSHIVQGRIFPNVWAVGTHIGDMTVEEAEFALLQAWNNDVRIRLMAGDRSWQATTADLGLKLNARPMAEAARGVGMAGLPFGWQLEPEVEIDIITAQNFLLDLAEEVHIPPFSGGYRLEGERVVGIPGGEGTALDVGLTLEVLNQNLASVAMRQQLDMIVQPLVPEFIDPEPYIDQAQALVSQPLQISGYDPYSNETVSWTTTPETLVSWVEAGKDGLTLREENFIPFMEAQNTSLNPDGENLRYLEPVETMEKMREAIAGAKSKVDLRVRYHPTTYEVQAGDRAFGIARKTGIPFFLIEQANPGKDLNVLSPGDILNLPSRDVAVPLDPVKNKRIVVNIDEQSLVAYENGEVVFSWKVSTGIRNAPTSPGTYQVLNHERVALGSSFSLCDDQGCGSWEMNWFMGIYEVQPGLMNGFHGAVELPNGTHLGGGNVGQPYTFGCVMSLDENAEVLYHWADVGTIVEIISSEYPPNSELARRPFPV